MTDDERARGIVSASTGNHGQSLAYGARLCDTRCVIAMPEEANPLKVESMRALGADVQFHGANFEEARTWAEAYARENDMRFVHHVNSPPLVAGVATISLEIIEDLPDVNVIVTPIGGGSAAIGHCLVAKALKPGLELIGVQAAGAPAVYNSWREHNLQEGPINTAAEGLATGHAYYTPVRMFIDHLDDMLLVSEQEMREARRPPGPHRPRRRRRVRRGRHRRRRPDRGTAARQEGRHRRQRRQHHHRPSPPRTPRRGLVT